MAAAAILAILCWAAVKLLPYVVGGRGRLTGGMPAADAAFVPAAAAPRPSKAAWKDKSLFLSSLTTGLTGMAGLADDVPGGLPPEDDPRLTGVCHGLDLDFSLLVWDVDGENSGLARGGAYVEGLARGGVATLDGVLVTEATECIFDPLPRCKLTGVLLDDNEDLLNKASAEKGLTLTSFLGLLWWW